ncbi:2-dehydropantoate 2-reductase N-terminal domain-containing protein [Streptomyces sp. MP131-18]|uniref:ketopantoate reductase family protein n=1 Tax=Streptomyces sp. MP131-18 TaxID=1857892 RepID=UPI00097BF26A|nr:2-dehydropantoate 2-reductase N-terminal domain-containing protein [Streptomyces sp. MP131-18]ONK12952.1 2-dehydropantoate 2-reductase [Streptomyces sp. MP131-18]
MRYLIIGAGAVGGAIGGRLFESGHDVVLVARGAHAAALREHGLRLHTPEAVLTLPVPVIEGPDAYRPRPDDVLVLAVKTQDSVAALDAWAPVAGGAPLVCAQNGVANERLALRRFPHVYGMCVWLPSQFLRAGEVTAPCAPLTGMLHLGRYPGGADDTARQISADLTASRFLSPVVPDVMRWKYAKLLANLANAVEALSGPPAAPPLTEVVAAARAEGVAVLDAAGLAYASEEEQARLRGDRMRIRQADGEERVGGSSWQSLRRGTGSIEADYLNGEIVLLGRRFGVPVPVNEALQRLAVECARAGRPPGSLPPAELAARTGVA